MSTDHPSVAQIETELGNTAKAWRLTGSFQALLQSRRLPLWGIGMAQPSVRWGETHIEREKKPGQAHLLRQAWAHNRESSVWVPRSRPWGCYTDASEHFRKCPQGKLQGNGQREQGRCSPARRPSQEDPRLQMLWGTPRKADASVTWGWGCGGGRDRGQELLGTHSSKYIQVKWLLANPLKKDPAWVMRDKAAPRSWRMVHRTGTGASRGSAWSSHSISLESKRGEDI